MASIPHTITAMKTTELIPYIHNARLHSSRQIDQIAASIREFGFLNPILVDDATKEVIAGHGRLRAAIKLCLDSVPVVIVNHLTDVQKRAYTLIDNTLALNATWDDALLRQELSNLSLDDFDLSLLAMDNSLLDIGKDAEDAEDDDDHDNYDAKNTKEKIGSKEFDIKDFSEFDNKCPKCGFEFNDKKGS